MSNASLYCLCYADSALTENMVFRGGKKEVLVPITLSVYLIKTKDKNILIDAGCNTLPGFETYNHYSPAFVLRQLGLTAADITDLVITHAHHDHIEAAKYFKNATLHITAEEYSLGKKFIPTDMAVNLIENELSFGDNIRVIKWGGHSKGSAIVEINHKGTVYVLCGDECYVSDCIKNKIPSGITANLEKSKEFVFKYSGAEYTPLYFHDKENITKQIF